MPRSKLFGRGAVALVVLYLATLPSPAQAAEGSRFTIMSKVDTSQGVVTSVSAYASQAGVDVLGRGGNAIDAAIATVFAVGVARPDTCGIGGGGFLVYRSARGEEAALDFRETAPGGVTNGQTFTDGIQADGNGHAVVGVPGMVAGMAAARERYGSGKFTLGQLIRSTTSDGQTPNPPYAYELARDGVLVTGDLALAIFLNKHRLLMFPETAKLYAAADLLWLTHQGGLPGVPLRQTDYARSLGLIAKHGPAAFYEVRDYGDDGRSIASLLVEEMAQPSAYRGDKGLMTAGDLAGYKAIWRTPLTGKYREHDLIAMPPPTSGGIATLEMLNILEGFGLSDTTSFGQSSANHLHVLAEAQKLAFADREAYVGDPDKVRVPTAALTSKGYATQRRANIKMEAAQTYPAGQLGTGHTTHVSVIDAAGNAVAVTCSLNYEFGSAVVAKGTGFLLNNQLKDFSGPTLANGDPHPNRAQPGKRPRSSQSPTIVVKGDKPVLVVGAAGGASIISGVVQTIVHFVDFNHSIARAVDAERIDAFGMIEFGNVLSMEFDNDSTEPRIAPGVRQELAKRGHPINCGQENKGCGEYHYLPVVQAAGVGLQEGKKHAAADPRKEGSACAQGTTPCSLSCPPSRVFRCVQTTDPAIPPAP